MEIDDSESTLRLQKCLQTFIFHVDDLIHEDDPSGDGFTREFKVIRDEGIKMREENTYPAEEGRRPCNIKKNRYKDILPFDQTRVTLTEIPGEDGSDYINANFIQDQYGAKCYIASQGPVQTTVYDFWRMIIQYKVKVIAMACKLIEMGKRKCEQYWPDMEEDVEEYRDITVTLVSQEDIADHLTKRVLRAVRAGHGSVTVTQFHYTGWPDHDIPKDFDVILEMMAEMREIKSQDTEKAPMVIHCSAGCGRTGTICAIDFAWDLLKTGNMDDTFSLYEIVKLMRTQRQSMIQAPEQYMMAHVTIQTLFQKHLDLMEDHTYGNIGFGDNSDEDSGKLDGSVSEAGSDLSGLHDGTRKRSVMEQDIANTIKKVTHVQTADELLNQTNATGSVPVGLPEPLTPAVYVAPEPPEHVMSPKINELKKTFSNENKTYTVEKIEMPNTKPATKIEERYLENLHKVEKSEKKMSFVSNEARQKDIESKRALYDKPKISEKPALEPQKSIDKTTSVIASSVKEQNNNQLTNDSKVNNERPLVQRVESQIQTGNKYVTVLSVGGVQDKKPTLSKTTSAPGPPINTPPQSFTQRSKTLSVKKSKIVEEKPQSSIPPESPAAQTGSMYSMAGNSQFYSSLSNYSSAVPEGTKNHVPNNKLSDSSAYSYAKATYDPYSAVDENPGDVHLSKPKVEASTIQNTQVYSYATEPVNPANNIYAGIDKKQMKPVGNRKSHEVDATYEAVTIGSTSDQMAPALPNRGYLEDGENQNIDKSEFSDRFLLFLDCLCNRIQTKVKVRMAFDVWIHQLEVPWFSSGDTNILGKKVNLMTLKNLLTGKGLNSSSSDNIVASDTPGFKTKLGKKPGGPKEKPSSWKKK